MFRIFRRERSPKPRIPPRAQLGFESLERREVPAALGDMSVPLMVSADKVDKLNDPPATTPSPNSTTSQTTTTTTTTAPATTSSPTANTSPATTQATVVSDPVSAEAASQTGALALAATNLAASTVTIIAQGGNGRTLTGKIGTIAARLRLVESIEAVALTTFRVDPGNPNFGTYIRALKTIDQSRIFLSNALDTYKAAARGARSPAEAAQVSGVNTLLNLPPEQAIGIAAGNRGDQITSAITSFGNSAVQAVTGR